jgi:hypothetical protein
MGVTNDALKYQKDSQMCSIGENQLILIKYDDQNGQLILTYVYVKNGYYNF